jgi:DNA repair protein RecO (recombination protein O)
VSSTEKTDAIVLRTVDFSETSCVVTLFTRGFGKISALAKGARRRKSPFEAALDVLSICRIVFIHKSSDLLNLLTEAQLERRFRAAQFDLSRLYAGYYVIELLTALTDDGDPHEELFDLAVTVIRTIDSHEPFVVELLRFEIRMLSILGHQPALHNCVSCGRAIPENVSGVSFGMIAGGVLCDQCRSGNRHVIRLSRDGLIGLRRLSKNNATWKSGEYTKSIGEMSAVIRQFIVNLLGFQPRLHPYLKAKLTEK